MSTPRGRSKICSFPTTEASAWVAAAWMAVAIHPSALAQQPPSGGDVTALAKATQNPVSDLTAVPFQFNFNTGGDLAAATFLNVNLQPAIPFRLTDGWNGIARTIVPMNSFPVGDAGRASGFGDIQEQLFFAPSTVGGIIWGVGPMFSFPTATAAPSQTGTWALGPGGVVLSMPGPWVIGGLIQQYWPIADASGNPKTDLFVLQPFVNYNFGRGWSTAFAPVIQANWNAESDDEWTVPLGFGVSRTTVLAGRPMSLSVQYYYNVVRPTGSAGEQLKFVLSFLYPKAK